MRIRGGGLMRTFSCRIVPCVVLFINLCGSACVSIAQQTQGYTPDLGRAGLPVDGTFSGGSIDTIQLNNGNLHIDIPLLHLRGIGMNTDIHFVYDSQIWNHAQGPSSNTNPNAPIFTLVTESRPPWILVDPLAGFLKWGYHNINWNCQELTGSLNEGGYESNIDMDYLSFTDSNGTAHPITYMGVLPGGPIPLCKVPGYNGAPPIPIATPTYSMDQYGYRFVANSSLNEANYSNFPGYVNLTDKHGRTFWFGNQVAGIEGLPAPLESLPVINGLGQMVNPSGPTGSFMAQPVRVEDTNGNQITGTINSNGTVYTVTDTVNRKISENMGSSCSIPNQTLPVSSEAIGRQPCVIEYTDQNGNTEKIQVIYGTTSPISQLPLCASGNPSCGGSTGLPLTVGVLTVPTEIILQNGETYSFSYNPNSGDTSYMGELTSVTLPTGATISYTWGGLNSFDSGRLVTSRTVSVGGQVSVWKYNYAYNSPQGGVPQTGPETVTVIDPLGNDTAYNCQQPPPQDLRRLCAGL